MQRFNTKNILVIAKSNWQKLAIVAIMSIVLSSFFSSPLFILPKYKSTAVVFPANLVPFSDESNTEQLLQFLQSEELKSTIAKRFDLYKHYHIDLSEEKAYSKFNEYYKANISTSANIYESVEIEVIDESPKLAQSIANGIIEEVNMLISHSKQSIVGEYLKNYDIQIAIKKNEIDTIQLQLKKMRLEYNLLDVESQLKVLSKRVGNSMSESDNKLYHSLQEHGDDFLMLQSKLQVELKSYKKLKMDYDKNLLNYNSKLSYTSIISKANLPDKKCAPLRLVIVIITTLSALLLALIILLFNHKTKQ